MPAIGKNGKSKEPSWPLVGIGLVVLLLSVLAVVWTAVDGTVVTERTEGTTKTTTTEAVPSDTLISIGLALSGVLVLLGFLWSRISSIKGGGIEVTMLDSREKDQTTEAVTRNAEKENKREPAAVATATTRALAEAQRRKAEKGTLQDQDFLDVARDAVASV